MAPGPHTPHPLLSPLLVLYVGKQAQGRKGFAPLLQASPSRERLPEEGQEDTWNLRALGTVETAVEEMDMGGWGPREPETRELDRAGS